jgi:hypothetical protein
MTKVSTVFLEGGGGVGAGAEAGKIYFIFRDRIRRKFFFFKMPHLFFFI